MNTYLFLMMLRFSCSFSQLVGTHNIRKEDPFCWGGNFHPSPPPILKRGDQKKNECLRVLKKFLPQILAWQSYYVFCEKRLCKVKYGIQAQFQMLILALHLGLHIISVTDFKLVQVLVQDLLLKSLLIVMALLKDVRRYHVQWIYCKKEKTKRFLTG